MISELERRVIAHLGIPRNATDLYMRLVEDPHAPVGPGTSKTLLSAGDATAASRRGLAAADDVDVYLREHLEAAGYVTKLAPADVGSLAVAVHGVHEWHDESRRLFAKRLADPARAWRVAGDTWVLSPGGVEALQEPVGSEALLEATQLQGAIDAEYGRVGDDVTTDEFFLWLERALRGYDHVRGSLRLPQPRPVIAGGASGWSDVFEARILDHENQKVAMPGLVDPWFLALSIRAINDTDTGTTLDGAGAIPTYTGYARKSVAASLMSSAAAGSSNNSGGAITFAACTAGSSVIVATANCSTSTGGELRKWGDIASTTISTTQTPATVSTGQYVTTAD